MDINKNHIKFSNKFTIFLITKNRNERSLGPLYYRGLIGKCYKAHYQIADIINKYSPYKINITGNEDDPVTVSSMDYGWYEDDSPIRLLNVISNNTRNLCNFIQEYNNKVKENIPENKSAALHYKCCLLGCDIKIQNVERY